MDGCSSFISRITAQKRLFQIISSEISVSGYDAFTEGGGSVSSREKASFGRSEFCPVREHYPAVQLWVVQEFLHLFVLDYNEPC